MKSYGEEPEKEDEQNMRSLATSLGEQTKVDSQEPAAREEDRSGLGFSTNQDLPATVSTRLPIN